MSLSAENHLSMPSQTTESFRIPLRLQNSAILSAGVYLMCFLLRSFFHHSTGRCHDVYLHALIALFRPPAERGPAG